MKYLVRFGLLLFLLSSTILGADRVISNRIISRTSVGDSAFVASDSLNLLQLEALIAKFGRIVDSLRVGGLIQAGGFFKGTADVADSESATMHYARKVAGDSAQAMASSGATKANIHDSLFAYHPVKADTILIMFPAEYGSAANFKGFASDTAYADSMTMQGGVDKDGNYIEILDNTDTTGTGRHKRRFQIQYVAPLDVDSLRRVFFQAKVYDGAGNESTYVIGRFDDSCFDSLGVLRGVYKAKDSTNAVTLTTVNLAGATAITAGSTIISILIEVASLDKHVTWGRIYIVGFVFHRRQY